MSKSKSITKPTFAFPAPVESNYADLFKRQKPISKAAFNKLGAGDIVEMRWEDSPNTFGIVIGPKGPWECVAVIPLTSLSEGYLDVDNFSVVKVHKRITIDGLKNFGFIS